MFKNLSLKSKLAVLSLIPLIAFIISISFSLMKNINDMQIIRTQQKNISLMMENIRIIKNLQSERGLSSRFIGGEADRAGIERARRETDSALEVIKNFLSESTFYLKYEYINEYLPANIKTVRNLVDSNSLSVIENMNQYSVIINNLFEINKDIAEAKTAAGIGKRLSSINIILLAQENAGRLRGFVAGILAVDRAVKWEILLPVISDYAGIASNLGSPAVLLSADSKAMAADLKSSPEWKYLNNSILSVLSLSVKGNYNIDNEVFWLNSTAVLELINKIADKELFITAALNERILKDFNKIFYITTLLILISVFLIFILSRLFIKNITMQINRVGHSLSDIAHGDGDLSIEIEETGNDELFLLARNFNTFTDTLNKLLHDIKREIAFLKDNGHKLTESMLQTSSAENQITATIESLKNLSVRQSGSVEKAESIIRTFISDVTRMKEMIEGQAAAVSQSSASIEQMMSNIVSVTKSAEKTGEIIKDLVRAAGDGKIKITQVADNIRVISEQSEMLQEANKMIASISAQTNLLSMNAAIEAAHAGTYGKGFAVVADEIRKLAVISSEQSKRISGNLKEIHQVIKTTVESSALAESAFAKMHDYVNNVDNLQNEVKNAMVEQSAGSNEILSALTNINEITEKIRDFAVDMDRESVSVLEEMKVSTVITSEVTGAVNEIFTGAIDINRSVNNLMILSDKNQSSINMVAEKVNKFKLKNL